MVLSTSLLQKIDLENKLLRMKSDEGQWLWIIG